MTYARTCRRHRTICREDGDDVLCPRGHVVPESGVDVVRVEDGHVAFPGGNGVKTIMTRKFTDAAGNTLYLRLTTSKRTPYVLRVQHTSDEDKVRRGVLSSAGDESTGVGKLDKLADQAIEQGWQETLGHRDGLTELPPPITRPRPKAAATKR